MSDHSTARCSCLCRVLLEGVHEIRLRAGDKGLLARDNLVEVRLYRDGRPVWQFRHVARQPGEGHRFFMRLKGQFFVRHTGQQLSRCGHFLVEFGKKQLADRHRSAGYHAGIPRASPNQRYNTSHNPLSPSRHSGAQRLSPRADGTSVCTRPVGAPAPYFRQGNDA